MPHAPTRVLFIHGLESGPTGTKVQQLRAQGFEVLAEDMHMSLRRWDKRNSVARCLLRLPELWLFCLALVMPLGLVLAMPVGAVVFWAGVALWGMLRGRAWIRLAMSMSLDRCVSVQREALRVHAPDVVVGSSWGGAVTVQLLLEGSWSGPTVLLAPAHRLVQERTNPVRLGELQTALQGLKVPLVVFHDPDDDVVPFVGSSDLSGIAEVVECPGGGHRLLPVLEDGRIADGIRRVAAKGER